MTTLVEELFPAPTAPELVNHRRLGRLVSGPYPFLGLAIASVSGIELVEYDVPATMERRCEIRNLRTGLYFRRSFDAATLVRTPADYIARELDRELDQWYGPTIDAMEDYLWSA